MSNENVAEGSRSKRNGKTQTQNLMDFKFELINGLYGAVNAETLRMKYYMPLPYELEVWYVYLLDGGHNIFVLLEQFEDEIASNPQTTYADHLIPCPVKTVLKGYRLNADGIVVVKGLEYSFQLGLVVPEDDFEFQNEGAVDEDLEKIKNQRQQILMFIAQHCAYIRLSCYGKDAVEILDNISHLQSYTFFNRFVETHMQFARSREELKPYELELLTLINWYENRIWNDVDSTFLSDNGWEHFFETYSEFINHATIKTLI